MEQENGGKLSDQDIMDIKREDMETIFRVLDDDCSGEVSYIEFCQHLASFWERDPVMLQSLVKYSIMEIRKVMGREIMDTLKEHSKILREQSRLLHEHFGSVPPSAPPVEEWVPPDLHSFASLQDELQPLLAKASMLVIDALPLEIATAFEDQGSLLSASVDPEAKKKAAQWKDWTSTVEVSGHDNFETQVSDQPDALADKIEEQFASLCEAFEHRIREADSFQQRCRSLVDYLKVLKTEAVNGKTSCCLQVRV